METVIVFNLSIIMSMKGITEEDKEEKLPFSSSAK